MCRMNQSQFSLPLGRESEEWAPLEALLQAVYRTANLSLRSLWSVSSPANLARFEKRTKNLNAIVPTVIAAQDLGDKLTLSSVCERGFPESSSVKEGIRIQIGNQSLPSRFLDAGLDGTRKQGRGRRVFECLLAKVGIGKSFVCSDQPDLLEDLDEEYDSVLIRPSAEEGSAHAVTVTSSGNLMKNFLPPHTFSQNYIVRESAQILPMFVCRFEVDTDKDEPLSLSACQNCELNPATIWCAADAAALCPECDEAHHSMNELTQRHVRVAVNERPRAAGACSVRGDKEAEFWSEAMGLAVCRETLNERFPNTAMSDIREAYKGSIRAARRQHEDLELVKQNLLSQIQAQQEAVLAVERMLDSCEETAYRKIADALQRTLHLTEERTAGLLEKETRLVEKIHFIQWTETLLIPLAHVLPPTDWLKLYLKHYRMVRASTLLAGPDDCQQAETYNAEIKLEGRIAARDLLQERSFKKLII